MRDHDNACTSFLLHSPTSLLRPRVLCCKHLLWPTASLNTLSLTVGPGSTGMLCCAVLCCAVLCCAALRCAVLCCAVLDRAVAMPGAVGSMFQGPSGAGSSSAGAGQPDFSSGREELLYGARQPEARGKGGIRSAAEIRSAYGRTPTRYGWFSSPLRSVQPPLVLDLLSNHST